MDTLDPGESCTLKIQHGLIEKYNYDLCNQEEDRCNGTNDDDDGGSGTIIGVVGAIAGLVAAVIICGIIYYCCKK